jgi:hypothetical protein
MVNRLNHTIAQERVADALRTAARERRAAAVAASSLSPLQRRALQALRTRAAGRASRAQPGPRPLPLDPRLGTGGAGEPR